MLLGGRERPPLPRIGDLRRAGESGRDGEDLVVLSLELGDELGHLRPRADESHVPAQHVPQLWELVEPAGRETAAERREARVTVGADRGAARIADHRAELQHREGAAATTDTLRAVEDGSRRVEQDGERHKQPDHEREREHEQYDRDVNRAYEARSHLPPECCSGSILSFV